MCLAKPLSLWLQCFVVPISTHHCVKCKIKLSKNGTLYYPNTTACFNIILSGDIELNPGPESSSEIESNFTVIHMYLQMYLQNVRSLKNKLDI